MHKHTHHCSDKIKKPFPQALVYEEVCIRDVYHAVLRTYTRGNDQHRTVCMKCGMKANSQNDVCFHFLQMILNLEYDVAGNHDVL